MIRNFGIQNTTARAASGAQPQPGPHYDAYKETRAVSEWVASNPERSQFAQAVIDILSLIVWMLLGVVSVVGVGGSFLVLGLMIFFG